MRFGAPSATHDGAVAACDRVGASITVDGVTVTVVTSATNWTHVPLMWVAPGVARGSITAARGEWNDYKLTRGSWDSVEKLANCSEAPNRTRIAAGTVVADTVERWRDLCR